MHSRAVRLVMFFVVVSGCSGVGIRCAVGLCCDFFVASRNSVAKLMEIKRSLNLCKFVYYVIYFNFIYFYVYIIFKFYILFYIRLLYQYK